MRSLRMNKALIEFYYQFHTNQHYFLCHDILEEAWKQNPSFSKNDGVVSLILFATASYHYRRGNIKGAKKSFRTSLKTIKDASDKDELGLKVSEYQSLIQQQIEAIKKDLPYKPIEIPITDGMKSNILNVHPNYIINETPTLEPLIIDHHLLRDRSEVIQNRLHALKEKEHNNNE